MVKLVSVDKDNVAEYVGKTTDTATFIAQSCLYAATSSYMELDGDGFYLWDGVSAWCKQ